MLVYVDDIIIIGSHSLVIQTIITKLQHEFPLKDLEPLHFFLGIQASRTAAGLHLCIYTISFIVLIRKRLNRQSLPHLLV